MVLDELGPDDSDVVITAMYASPSCSTPTVLNPFDAPYQITLERGEFAVCPELNQAAQWQRLEVRAAVSQVPALRPVISVIWGQDSRYFESPAMIGGYNTIALEYCARLDLTVRTHGENGFVRTLPEHQVKWIITDDGGCGPLESRPDAAVSTRLANDVAYSYSLGPGKISLDSSGFPRFTRATMPTFTVDPQGESKAAILDLYVNCVTVAVGDRTSRVTEPNCPGGAGDRYLKGTVVQLAGDVHDDEGIYGWYGSDEWNGTTAWVIAEEDRSVAISIDSPSSTEKFVNTMSGLAQRIVAAAVIVATGLVLAKMLLLKITTMALKGVGELVSIAGGGDDMKRAMNRLDNTVNAVMSTVGLFSTCVSQGARGKGTLTQPPSGAASTGVAAASGAAAVTGRYAGGATGGGAKVILTARTAVDLFGSNTSLYSKDAAQAWTSMGTGLGGCMKSGLQENAEMVGTDK
ncbi:hypothetical protein E3T43_08450 [Cryobacterium sp. Hh7]|uniref:hypothetical protein n=1 Tax=Cryobacterium sp. Hh7 TaxID=1259159 RepID=UPI00106DC76C|nr:hypothetical protein [Cryobacterium sp. Hh7]TFD56954.1 hypothetical protein E3T43_08450 [Cryobacterium sp. Hh7]